MWRWSKYRGANFPTQVRFKHLTQQKKSTSLSQQPGGPGGPGDPGGQVVPRVAPVAQVA